MNYSRVVAEVHARWLQGVQTVNRLVPGSRIGGLPGRQLLVRRAAVQHRRVGRVADQHLGTAVLIPRASGTTLVLRASGTTLVLRASGTTLVLRACGTTAGADHDGLVAR